MYGRPCLSNSLGQAPGHPFNEPLVDGSHAAGCLTCCCCCGGGLLAGGAGRLTVCWGWGCCLTGWGRLNWPGGGRLGRRAGSCCCGCCLICCGGACCCGGGLFCGGGGLRAGWLGRKKLRNPSNKPPPCGSALAQATKAKIMAAVTWNNLILHSTNF